MLWSKLDTACEFQVHNTLSHMHAGNTGMRKHDHLSAGLLLC